jgi:FlaA1/EpsC-like NDP-sugar epimerase
MSNKIKTVAILVIDMACVTFAFGLAYLFRFDFDVLKKVNMSHAAHGLLLSIALYALTFFIFKLHRVIWRYASLSEMIRLTKQVALGFVLTAPVVYMVFGLHYVPLSIFPLQAFFYLSMLVASRGMYRLYRGVSASQVTAKQILIIGAGSAGEGMLREMLRHADRGYRPIGLLDDDPSLQGRSIHGVKVRGRCDQLKKILIQSKPDMVVLAIPSLQDNHLLNQVYETCRNHQVPVRVLPGLSHLTEGRVNIDALRKVAIEDLLGREPVSLLNETLMSRVQNKVVLVTGGGGSIGSELCRQIAVNQPDSLLVVDNNEFNLYNIERELKHQYPSLTLQALLIDVTNRHEITRCLAQYRPHILFHAAAFKHVPMLERQAFSAVKTNVLATQQLADLAAEWSVEDFILVSTDKAVNPTNIMGVSKRLAEIYCQNKNTQVSTRYMTVRFGNVLGSAGSVLPLFREQLAKGGPLTVTDPKMVRYFMTIPEAVSLILQSFLIGSGGEIFVLDMGEPVKIVELAEKLITLSGKTPYKQIDIVFSGIRPGEKLFEELFYDAEALKKTSEQKILELQSRTYDWGAITALFTSIQQCYLNSDHEAMLRAMLSLVPEYQGEHQESATLILD